MGEFNVNKSDGSLDPTAGMPETYPATQVMMSDGVTSVKDALDNKIGYNSTTNLDACIKSGIYSYTWDANNAPSAHSGAMLVISYTNGTSGVQIARSSTVNIIYVRFWDSSTFTTWSSVSLTT